MTTLAPTDRAGLGILTVRGQNVMLDVNLARLYGVPTKALNRAVKRNRERFPEDFMFQLTNEEAEDLRRQTDTSKSLGGASLPSLRVHGAGRGDLQRVRAIARLWSTSRSCGPSAPDHGQVMAELRRKVGALERR
jgi:hypothetical protein